MQLCQICGLQSALSSIRSSASTACISEAPLHDVKERKTCTLEFILFNLKISPRISLEGMMLKLKLQYFGHLMRRVDSLEKTLMLGGIGPRGEGDDRGWDGWMASLTRWMWVWVNSGSWWWTGRPRVLRFMGSQRVGHDWGTELSWPERFLCRSVYFRGGTFAYIEDVYIAY